MSASLDQRAKGQPNQVSGAPGKDGMSEEEKYMAQPHQKFELALHRNGADQFRLVDALSQNKKWTSQQEKTLSQVHQGFGVSLSQTEADQKPQQRAYCPGRKEIPPTYRHYMSPEWQGYYQHPLPEFQRTEFHQKPQEDASYQSEKWTPSRQEKNRGAYTNPGQMPSPGGSESFFQSYYTPNPNNMYPFMSQGLSTTDGTWSNGGDTPMFPMSYDYSSMYSSFGFPFGSWEYPSDYWGNAPTQPAARKDPRPYPETDPYYADPSMMPADTYGMMNGAGPDRGGDPMGGVEQGLRGMTLQQQGGGGGPMDSKKMVDGGMGGPEMVGGGGGGMPPPPQEMVAPPSQQVSAAPMHGNVSSGGHQQGMGLSVVGGGGGVGVSGMGGGNQAPKKTSWAAIASQPARPQTQVRPRMIPRAPANPNKPHNMDIGTWENRGGMGGGGGGGGGAGGPPGGKSAPGQRQAWSAPRQRQMGGGGGGHSTANSNSNNSSGGGGGGHQNHHQGGGGSSSSNSGSSGGGGGGGNGSGQPQAPAPHPVLDKLKQENMYNPKEFDLNPKGARFFIIKSYSEDDIHRSIKYNIWCSTEHGNKRLDCAFRERESKGPVYLLFSVNGSGHFCGLAQMLSPIDYNKNSSVWAQDKWKGQFEVKWVYVKDVPNSQLRHIRLENNENKPVTNSRDTQEVPPEKGKQVMRILHSFKHTTSIFDDFTHYEKRQEEDQMPGGSASSAAAASNNAHGASSSGHHGGGGHSGGSGGSGVGGGADRGGNHRGGGDRDRGSSQRGGRDGRGRGGRHN